MDEDKNWKILIVDDDEQTHLVTKLALKGLNIFGRGIDFYQAYNSQEAFDLLKDNRDMTVILLDVVMESDNAGLDLVKRIREDLDLHSVRIIIRTGQPGEAPELEVIQQYDINDYKMKSELTQTRLVSSLISAVRSYQQFQSLARNKTGMEKIISSSRELFHYSSIGDYSDKVMKQVCELLGEPTSVCIALMDKSGEFQITSGTGLFQQYFGKNLRHLDSPYKIEALSVVVEESSFFADDRAYLFLPNDHVHKGLIIIKGEHNITEGEHQLLRVFSTPISVGFENHVLLDRLHRSAYFDPLCLLPNRTSFIEEISLRQNQNKKHNIAIIDVIQFSEFNNSMGYHMGDFLLRSVAERLGTFCHDDCFIARIGGDNFGLIGPADRVVPESLLSLFSDPFEIEGDLYPLKATLGLIEMNGSTLSPQELLQKADMALRSAKKKEGIVFQYYDGEMDRIAKNRIMVTRDLKSALDSDEMVLHFQPQLNLNTGRLSGAESLIRWKKKEGGLVPPSQFVPIAEQSGLIINLGKTVFRKSLDFLSRWIGEGNEPFRIGINVSVRQFLDDHFNDFLTNTLKDYDVDPKHVELEITESILMHDLDKGINIMKHAKNLGMTIAIDDFGTGFSSLSYLQKLPIDRLKIDRSFIMNLEDDKKAQKLTQMIVNLAKQLNLELIAEGVETEEQIGFLRALECDEVQGFLFSKPLQESDFRSWIKQL